MVDTDDGTKHINVYARGCTQLGRDLSNFAHTVFDYAGYTFHSVEAWWYWRRLPAGRDDPKLRAMFGVAAKFYGQQNYPASLPYRVEPVTTQELTDVYKAKLSDNPSIGLMLAASKLPFDHYYFYSGKRVNTPWRWTGQLWNDIRREINHG